MEDKKYILVTGGAGYIGSHTCKELAKAGYTPVTFDNLSNGHTHAVKWGPFIEGDIRNIDDLNSAFEAYPFSAVIHFAGLIEVGESVQKPELYYQNNVVGSLNLLNAIKDYKVTNIVFSSTCAVYGIPENVPITEDEKKQPINPYGANKMMVEQMLHDFSIAHDLKYVACRYFNACGADPDLEIGEEHDPETHLIPLLLQTAAKERKSFSIFGTDYDTEDGTCIRDYIHVQDLAKAHVKALQYLENGNDNNQFNLGTGTGYSVHQIIRSVEEITETNLNIVETDKRPGDAPALVANPEKSKKILGFSPESSDIDTIIKTAWDFHLQKNKQNQS